MRILIATDAYYPQVNGVVRSYESLSTTLIEMGHEVTFLTHYSFRTIPFVDDIRFSLATPWGVASKLKGEEYDHIHIATEGPIGWATRSYCLRNRVRFTTSYHTKFPEYISIRTGIPESLSYTLFRFFHNAGDGIMVSTDSMITDLSSRGFSPLMKWGRGVDHGIFNPSRELLIGFENLRRPVFLYVGRISPEKNIEGFLNLELPGSKVLIGDGPDMNRLQKEFPQAHFKGVLKGTDLASVYASSDVFVFPSVNDTFGLVMIEALACGTPVAAFPVPGPIDVIGDSGAGVLDCDLRAACLEALKIPREKALAHGRTFTWEKSAKEFLTNVGNTGNIRRA